MVTLEQVEKLCERANISYDEAKAALEAANGDLLDAIISLERQGRVKAPNGGGCYHSGSGAETASEEKAQESQSTQDEKNEGTTFSELIGRFFNWCGDILHKGNINTFDVLRDGNTVMSIPVTVLVLLLIFVFWITLPLIIIGLFFGYRYVFKGPHLEREQVNGALNSAADAAENLKREVKNHAGDKK